MSSTETDVYRIALSHIPLVGPVVAKNLLAYCGSADAVFTEKLSMLKRIPGVGDKIASNIYTYRDFDRCEKEVKFIEKENLKTIFFTDKSYPYRLKQLHDAPLMLFQKGNCDLNRDKHIAIVGTRKCTAYSKDMCGKIIKDLTKFDCTIVSGLASGIDTEAHKGALANKLPTIAVVAHGLDRIYPSLNYHLAEKIIDEGGAIITEYMTETIPEREHFPARNRIVAGLADGLIVMESPKKGGSMITAELAFQNDREVFAVPNRVGDKNSGGCHFLIKTNKAQLIESATDIARAMNWDIENRIAKQQKTLAFDLPDNEQEVFDYLKQNGPTEIDKLALELKSSTSKLAITLLELEFKNTVRNLPGKIYEIV